MDDRDQQQTAGTDSCDDRRARFNYHPNDCYDFKLQRGMNNPIPLDGSGLDYTYFAHEVKCDRSSLTPLLILLSKSNQNKTLARLRDIRGGHLTAAAHPHRD